MPQTVAQKAGLLPSPVAGVFLSSDPSGPDAEELPPIRKSLRPILTGLLPHPLNGPLFDSRNQRTYYFSIHEVLPQQLLHHSSYRR